ncbi:MAG: glycosyltransferase family 2 protein [Armatimonadetes bacterium]|nr:glycosyltransferase family 2 protein [Armatimonadota bacterium]
MKLSVVVVNWNTGALLRACLRSLLAHPLERTGQADQEILVIDNASADGSADMVRREFPGVTLIANETNLGYAAANNQGIRRARGEYLLLLNPDTEVPPGGLATLVSLLEAHPEAAAAAPRLVGLDGRTQRSVRGFPSPIALLAEITGLAALFPRRLGGYRVRGWNHDSEREVDQPMTSCLLIRRQALEQVGLMDEAFPIFFNDVDWCYRARQRGWTIRFTPRVAVLHHYGASTSQVRGAMIRESGRSLARFYRKHYRGRIPAPLYAACVAAMHLGTGARGLWCRARTSLSSSSSSSSSSSTRDEPSTRTRATTRTSRSDGESQTEATDVVVAVVNWNTRDDLEACLRSVYERNDNPPSYAVGVVDNASVDGSAEMVAGRFPQAALLRNRENRGFSAANNQIIKGSQSRYVLLLNPDAQTHPGTLAALVRFMDENPDIGICGPLVLNPDGSVQYSARRFPTLLAGAFRNTLLGRLFPRNRYTREYLLSDWDHRTQRDVDWVSGAAMMIRRAVLDQVGILDERFFMYSEDVDICFRARAAGWRVTFFPGAAVTHARAHSSDKAQLRSILQFHRSMYRFWRKHYAPRSSWPVRLAAPVAIGTRAGLLAAKNLTDRVRARWRV